MKINDAPECAKKLSIIMWLAMICWIASELVLLAAIFGSIYMIFQWLG